MSEQAREWDRRKAYLIRSLFEDLPLLSPIPERREPDQSDIEDPYTLPDLIIEREKNHHDEAEEFYEDLEKRILKLYRKLFHCQHDEDSVLSLCSISSHSTRELINYETSEDSDNEGSNRIDDVSTRASEDSNASQMIHESYVRSTETESSEEPQHEVITTQALIHAGELSQGNKYRAVLKKPVQSPIIECKHTQIIKDWDEQFNQSMQDATLSTANCTLVSKPWRPSNELLDENMARLVAKQANTQKFSKSSCYEFGVYDFSPIEVMRQEGSKDNREESIPEVRYSRGSSKEPEFDGNLNEKETSVKEAQSLIEEEMASDESSDGELEMSDAGDLLNEALRDITIISSPILDTTSRKRLLSGISNVQVETPTKRAKCKNVGLQTIEGSLSYVPQPSRDRSPTDFFYGTPMIFNVCSCIDHICKSTFKS